MIKRQCCSFTSWNINAKRWFINRCCFFKRWSINRCCFSKRRFKDKKREFIISCTFRNSRLMSLLRKSEFSLIISISSLICYFMIRDESLRKFVDKKVRKEKCDTLKRYISHDNQVETYSQSRLDIESNLSRFENLDIDDS